MQRSAPRTASLLTTAALASLALSAGCASDVGNCDDPARGRSTVQVGGQLLFTGQAIITKSCASCHGSGAKEGSRRGAPYDLNFDLAPIEPSKETVMSGNAIIGVKLDEKQLKGLRARQRKVYEQRSAIWDQVESGLMPPSNVPLAKMLSGIVRSAFGSDGKCTAGGQELTTLGADKEELRKWLACGTPVIETNSPDLPYKAPAAGLPASETAAGSVYYATDASVGYQYPSCGGGSTGGDGGTPTVPSFSDVFKTAFLTCAGCHPGVNASVDFTTEDKAFASIVGKAQAAPCKDNPVPYVTPGDPSKSYILAKMDMARMSGPFCGADLMPPSAGSTAANVALVRNWIMGGALRNPAAATGGDAGVADAGM